MSKKILRFILPLLLFGLIGFSFAQQQEFPGWTSEEVGRVSPLPTIGVGVAVYRFATLVFYLMAFLALVFIIYAAIIMVTASGDPGKIETARAIIMYALIALAIGVVAYGLVALVYSYLTRT
jgi:hypothetical protein